MVLKFLSRSFGKFLVSISLTIFILSFLTLSLANNTDALKSSLSSDDLLEILAEESDMSIDEIKTLCQRNPNQEDCDVVNDPSKLMDEQFAPLTEKIDSFRPTIYNARIASIVIFIIGIVFLFFGTSNIVLTLYKVSFTILFSSIFYLIFLSLITTQIPTIAQNLPMDQQQDVPQELLDLAVNSVISWMQLPIQETITICIYLLVPSLILTIIFFILKRKQKEEKPKKQSS